MHARSWHTESEDAGISQSLYVAITDWRAANCLMSSVGVRKAASCATGCLTLGGWLPLMVAEIKRRRFASIHSNF